MGIKAVSTSRDSRSLSPRASMLRDILSDRRRRTLVLLIAGAQVVTLVALLVAALAIGHILQEAVIDHRYRGIPRAAVLFGVAYGVRLAGLRAIDYLAVRIGTNYGSQVAGEVVGRAGEHPIEGTELGYLMTDGVATLIPYASRFLPEVIAASIVTPALILFTLVESPMAFIEVMVGLVVLPVMMIVIGASTRDHADRQLTATVRLNALYLDILAGMVTLRAFNKARLQERAIANAADELRKRTMGVLRIAFISGVSLDTLVAIIVALVAVSIGIRLNDGSMSLATGAAVLFVTPEIFRPIRAAALQFHATQDAEALRRRISDLSVSPPTGPRDDPGSMVPVRLWRPAPVATDVHPLLELRGFGVNLPNGDCIESIDLALARGDMLVVRGESGVGKTSWLRGLAGLGSVVGDVCFWGSTTQGDPLGREHVSFLPANPGFVDGSIVENLTLLHPEATESEIHQVLDAVGLLGFVERLGEPVLPGGANFSAGERQRLGVARALLMGRPILILDEPTAHLNAAVEAQILNGLVLFGRSRVLIIASHSDRVEASATQVLRIGDVL